MATQMANPFYVHPGGDYGAGLTALGENMSAVVEKKRQQQYYEESKAAMQAAYQSKDPDQIMEAVIKYPELQKMGEMLYKFKDENTKKIASQTYFDALMEPDDEIAMKIMADGINAVDEAGGRPDNMINDLGLLKSDRERFNRKSELGMAWINPDMYGAFKDARDRQLKEREIGLKGTIARNKLRTEKVKADLVTTKDNFDRSKKIRDEVFKTNKDYRLVRDAYNRIEASEDTAPGDMAMIFNYMKMLDPGSTVREGEFATAQQTTGIPGRIVNAYNRAYTGKRLNTTQRKSFKSQAKKLFESQKKTADKEVNRLVSLGKPYGLSRIDIMGEGDEFQKQEISVEDLVNKYAN